MSEIPTLLPPPSPALPPPLRAWLYAPPRRASGCNARRHRDAPWQEKSVRCEGPHHPEEGGSLHVL